MDWEILEMVRRAADETVHEFIQARAQHAPMHSAHEGYAVLLEELDELWAEVKAKHQNRDRMRAEAIQVGAMALAFIVEVCDTPPDTAPEQG